MTDDIPTTIIQTEQMTLIVTAAHKRVVQVKQFEPEEVYLSAKLIGPMNPSAPVEEIEATFERLTAYLGDLVEFKVNEMTNDILHRNLRGREIRWPKANRFVQRMKAALSPDPVEAKGVEGFAKPPQQ